MSENQSYCCRGVNSFTTSHCRRLGTASIDTVANNEHLIERKLDNEALQGLREHIVTLGSNISKGPQLDEFSDLSKPSSL
jgi:hypothetical protein